MVVGDTTETYPRPDGVIERWTWLDDFEGARPATLVMQLAGVDGTYQNYFGSGPSSPGTKGVRGVCSPWRYDPLSPAADEAAAEPAAEDAAADAPAAEDAAAGEAASRRHRRTRNGDSGRARD